MDFKIYYGIFPTTYKQDGLSVVPYLFKAEITPIPANREEQTYVQNLFKNELKIHLLKAKNDRPKLEVDLVLTPPEVVKYDTTSIYKLTANCYIKNPDLALKSEKTKTTPNNPEAWFEGTYVWQKK